jgi:preprotein translocase subunit SecE
MVKKVVNFFQEVKVEITKVSWPTRKELYGSTVVVLVSCAIMAVFIGGVDFALSRILNLLFK